MTLPIAHAMLLHGLTGMPSMLRPLVRALEAHHIRAVTPTIAGHCSTIAELAKTGLDDWLRSVEEPFAALTQESASLFVGGISLGGVLSLDLALRHPEKVRGCILMSAALSFPLWLTVAFNAVDHSPARFFYKGQKRWNKGIADPLGRAEFECYDYFPFKSIQNLFALQRCVVKRLHTLQVPTLMIHSRGDKTVPISAVEVVKKRVNPALLTVVTLEKSEHVITLDVERDQVAQACVDFITRLAK